MPVLLKTLARGRAPFQWTGGLLHSIPKPGKLACCPETWRSILLIEADGNAVLKAERHGLVRVFQNSKAAAQAGGLPDVPASFVRAHLVNLRQQNISGGIIFFNVKSAYYSVIRHLLTSTRVQRQDPAYACACAAEFFTDPVLRENFVQEFRQGNLLAALGADEATVAYFQAHLRCTWYVTHCEATQVYQANSGTAPGSPVADVLFGLLFSRFLDGLQQLLEAQGIVASVTWASADADGGPTLCPGQPGRMIWLFFSRPLPQRRS